MIKSHKNRWSQKLTKQKLFNIESILILRFELEFQRSFEPWRREEKVVYLPKLYLKEKFFIVIFYASQIFEDEPFPLIIFHRNTSWYILRLIYIFGIKSEIKLFKLPGAREYQGYFIKNVKLSKQASLEFHPRDKFFLMFPLFFSSSKYSESRCDRDNFKLNCKLLVINDRAYFLIYSR